MKNNKYCLFCGALNEESHKICKKCHKIIKPELNDFLKYLKDNINDELKDKVEDKVTSIIINYIKSHLYGFILTCSIVLSVASGVIVHVNNTKDIVNVLEKPTVMHLYRGEGLTSREVVTKYVEALSKDALNTATSLQLDNYYPELKKDFPRIVYFIDDSEFQKPTHILLSLKDTYFSHLNNYNISSLTIEEDEGYSPYYYQDKYLVETYTVTTEYCSFNNCDNSNKLLVTTFVQTVQIDGNFYVSASEYTAMDIGSSYKFYMLQKENGNPTNLDFNKLDEELYACIDNYVGCENIAPEFWQD